MNICFVMGNIISDINFEFILNGKNDSIVFFKISLLNNSIINIIAFNEKADYCYRNLKKGDNIFVEGELNSNEDVIVKRIYGKGWDKDGKREKQQ